MSFLHSTLCPIQHTCPETLELQDIPLITSSMSISTPQTLSFFLLGILTAWRTMRYIHSFNTNVLNNYYLKDSMLDSREGVMASKDKKATL
jgi:hypothetical protein